MKPIQVLIQSSSVLLLLAMLAPKASAQALPPLAGEENAPFEQVTSVSQLSDVKPTDWAFQALQSLVERYGCIAGYPARSDLSRQPCYDPLRVCSGAQCLHGSS